MLRGGSRVLDKDVIYATLQASTKLLLMHWVGDVTDGACLLADDLALSPRMRLSKVTG